MRGRGFEEELIIDNGKLIIIGDLTVGKLVFLGEVNLT